ncbi:unnamed protein product [Prorocentrum cordatum]|uniref:EF-hand domain-containing protein n=1 Tax=Prorocentrum cordatum TaxID=2364126 RepID=A0ABN9W9N0_9DINO|nr:unnamed protein product [Polarella glacialis]
MRCGCLRRRRASKAATMSGRRRVCLPLRQLPGRLREPGRVRLPGGRPERRRLLLQRRRAGGPVGRGRAGTPGERTRLGGGPSPPPRAAPRAAGAPPAPLAPGTRAFHEEGREPAAAAPVDHAAASGGAAAAAAAQAEAHAPPRAQLVRAAFARFDADGDGVLSESEMRAFAVVTGFDGTEADWAEESTGCSARLAAARSTYRASRSSWTTPPRAAASAADDELLAVLGHGGAGAGGAPDTSERLDRQDLSRAVFFALDRDGDGALSEAEMRRFAAQTGFEGSPEELEWSTEYRALCLERGATRGLDLAVFRGLVDDKSAAGCHCSDQQLAEIAHALQADRGGDAATGASQPNRGAHDLRGELARAVFALLDGDGDGRLAEADMRSFATLVGFDGDAAAWATEYRQLAADRGFPPAVGASLGDFLALIDDRSESGSFVSDEHLQLIVDELGPRPPLQSQTLAAVPLQRDELVGAIFARCDADGDGLLNEREMLVFVRHAGFDGSLVEWAGEYRSLCRDNHVDPEVGITSSLLKTVVSDLSDCGLYCKDEELRDMLASIEVEAAAPRAAREPSTTQG